MTVPRPLRICYVSDERFPSRWTDTQQIVKTATALAAPDADPSGGQSADQRFDVDLVLPRRFGKTFFKSATDRRTELTRYYGVSPAFDLTQLVTFPAGRLRIEKFTHGVASALYARLHDHDVVYTRNVLPLVLSLAMGKYAVFESHRVLKLHYPFTYRAIRWARRFPRFLGVVTNAGFIARAFCDMGFAPAQVTVVHNSFDPLDMEPRLTREAARAQVGVGVDDPRPIVCYAGHIQRRKGIDTVIELAARIPEALFLVCGGFPEDVAAAEEIARARGATNLHFTGWIDVARLAPFLYASDVLLIPPTRAPLERYGNTVLPIKTYTYLAAGRVIVAPRLPDVEEVLHDGENALLTTPDNLDEAVATIRRALGDTNLAARIAAAARESSNQYTWAARAGQIREFITMRLNAVRRTPASDRREG